MQELEILLNSLIQRGWKPWGIIAKEIRFITTKRFSIHFCEKGIGMETLRNLHELVSLESGLWQFCMENELLNSPDQYPHKDFRAKNPRPYGEMSLRWDTYYKTEVYQYRLLESALVPEEELGIFLLDNIIIKGNSK